MKRPGQILFGVVLIMGAVTAAQADIGAFSFADTAAPQPIAAKQVANQPQSQAAFPLTGLDVLSGVKAGGGLPQAEEGESVNRLPADPASLSLVLCGLGSLGVWQLGRAARHLHFGQVPEWFHTGGPTQIGHTFAADPNLGGSMTLCQFDPPTGEQPILHYLRCESPPILLPQCILITEAPRGPPFLS